MADNDRVIVVTVPESNGGSRRSSSKGSGAASTIGTIMVVGALGIGAYLVYNWLKGRQSCDSSAIGTYSQVIDPDTGQTVCMECSNDYLSAILGPAWVKADASQCSGGSTCNNGDTRCDPITGVSQICQGNAWTNGGTKQCGGTVKGDACSVPGSGYCKGGLYFVCAGDNFAYSDNTPCTPADIANCNGMACVQSTLRCGGIIPGDSPTDLYQDLRCNPKTGKCNFMQVYPGSSYCAARVLGAATVSINNHSIDPNTSKINPYVIYEGDRATIIVTATDSKGVILKGASVKIDSDSPDWGGFANLSDLSDHRMNCSTVSGITGDMGKAGTLWLFTAFKGIDPFGNNGQTVKLKITVTYNDTSLVQYIYLSLVHGEWVAGLTADGVLYGTICCGASSPFPSCEAQSTMDMESI